MKFPGLLILALGLASGCSSPESPPRGLGEPPQGFLGFPAEALSGPLYAQARYYPDHRSLFGLDLLQEQGIIPVELTVQLASVDEDTPPMLVSSSQMEPALILQDGTVLASSNTELVASRLEEKDAARVRDRALRGGLLNTGPQQGFLYFRLPRGAAASPDGIRVAHVVEGVERISELSSCLVSFRATIEEVERTFYVGLAR